MHSCTANVTSARDMMRQLGGKKHSSKATDVLFSKYDGSCANKDLSDTVKLTSAPLNQAVKYTQNPGGRHQRRFKAI